MTPPDDTVRDVWDDLRRFTEACNSLHDTMNKVRAQLEKMKVERCPNCNGTGTVARALIEAAPPVEGEL